MAVRHLRHELFSADEIAQAAGVPASAVEDLVQSGRVVAFRRFVAPSDAIRLVRRLAKGEAGTGDDRSPLTTPAPKKRRGGLTLAMSGTAHVAAFLLASLAATCGLLSANDTEQSLPKDDVAHLVFFVSPGPGGGGGGGGLRMPDPPPVAKAKAPVLKKLSSPVPAVVRRPPAPPQPAQPQSAVNQIVSMPKPIDRPQPVSAPAVQAPVVSKPADLANVAGLVTLQAPPSPSAGSGTGGGTGSGAGTGLGSGSGAGIGPGSGGGTGGGPYGPGSGIEAPKVLQEVRPVYTEEARRRGIQGAVALEIVVTRDGRVSDVRVLRGLGAGLDQKAVDAVRQWRFSPARLRGTPVDVVADVSVDFALR